MTISARTTGSPELEIDAAWILDFNVTDADGCATDDTVVITVTLPDGTTTAPTVEEVSSGRYRAVHIVATAGRYLATAVGAEHGTTSVAAFVSATSAAGDMPDLADVLNYLGWNEDNAAGDAAEALAAESANQRRVCDVGAVYPRDLRHALYRRVARDLQMKGIPLAVLRGDAESGGNLVLPGADPVVRRLEAPHRKLFVG